MDSGAWQATVCGVAKSQTRLSDTAEHRMLGGGYVVDQTHLWTGAVSLFLSELSTEPPSSHLLPMRPSSQIYVQENERNKSSHVALVVKNPPANGGDSRDTGSIPALGRSPGEGNGDPLQYSCLGNPVDRGIWQSTVHGVTKSWAQLSTCTHTHTKIEEYLPDEERIINLF